MPNWWHARPGFPEMVQSLRARTKQAFGQAFGDIGNRARPHLVTQYGGPPRTSAFDLQFSFGRADHFGNLVNLPDLEKLIGRTEDFGAVLLIPLAIEHNLSGTREVTNLGGWMDDSFFFVTNDATGVDRVGASPATLKTEAYTVGVPTDAPPKQGDAHWTGAMVGVDHDKDGGRYGRTIAGKAWLHIEDFSDPSSMTVSMLNMLDTIEGRPYDDIIWRDVQIHSDGQFTPDGLVARFFGPDGDEVGGVFVRNDIAGAFGASRSLGEPPD